MTTTAAHRFRLTRRARSSGVITWSPFEFYEPGTIVEDNGKHFLAIAPVAKGHRPQGTGDGSTADRQRLLSQLSEGFAGNLTTGGGIAGATYTVDDPRDQNTLGCARHALAQDTPLWIRFDPTVFPLDSPTPISHGSNCPSFDNKTIDGRGAGVVFQQYPIQVDTTSRANLTAMRGRTVANWICAYVTFSNFPNITSVLQFGGSNPWSKGGADLVYLHHLTVDDTEDQQHSNGAHRVSRSRSTTDWSRFGPAPGLQMASNMTLGQGLKRFTGKASDDTITTLNSLGNPAAHDLRRPFTVDVYPRASLALPGSLTPGPSYTPRNVGFPSVVMGTSLFNVTFDATTDTVTTRNGSNTPVAHNFAAGDAVIFNGTTLPTGMQSGFTYYLKSAPGTNTFQFSRTLVNGVGGGKVDFTTAGSGTMTTQKADPTRFTLSTSSAATGWETSVVNISSDGVGLYVESTEPAYYDNAKGPQWGSHHDDDLPDGMLPFRIDPADSTGKTLLCDEPHNAGDGTRVRFWSQADNLPTNIVPGQTYWMRDSTSAKFRLAATAGGVAIDPGTDRQATVPFTVTQGGIDAGAAEDHTGYVTVAAGALPVGTMLSAINPPAPFVHGKEYWAMAGPDSTKVLITDRKSETEQVRDPTALSSSGAYFLKTPTIVQFLNGPNLMSMTKCDFYGLKIRSPKVQVTHAHVWNTRVRKWGDPYRGDLTGGFGHEVADGGQLLLQGMIGQPYRSDGTEEHLWSRLTNPHESVPCASPSIYAVNMDAGVAGPVTPAAWQGGGGAILEGLRLVDGATTRNAQSGQTVIVNSPRLDFYDPPNGINLPYSHTVIPVPTWNPGDPIDTVTELDEILNRGAGNVQPWRQLD